MGKEEKKRRAAYGWLPHPSLASHKEGSAAFPNLGEAGPGRDWNRRRAKPVSAAGSQKLKFAHDLEKADGGEQGRSKKFDSFLISGELLDTKF